MRDDLATLEIPADMEDRFGRYRDDPAGFVRDVLGAEPQPYQVEVLRSAASNPRVPWRAAHGCGKTATLDAETQRRALEGRAKLTANGLKRP